MASKKNLTIDLNCDLAQSFGVYKNDAEFKVVPYCSTINVSCGAHAGDPLSIMEALETIQGQNFALSAHIGYPDLQGFGYREMNLTEKQMQALVIHQLGSLSALAKIYNMDVEYVRPHGAMYKQAAEDINVSIQIANAIKSYNPWLIYVGASGETLEKVAEETGVRVAHEIILDKQYDVEGNMLFNEDDVTDTRYCINQLELVLNRKLVKNNQGGLTKVKCDTIHLGSKNGNSIEIAQRANHILSAKVPVAVGKVESSGWV